MLREQLKPKGEPGLVGMDSVLGDTKGEILFMFSKHAGVKESNEVRLFWIFSHPFKGMLIVQSDSSNAVFWVSSSDVGSYKISFLF